MIDFSEKKFRLLEADGFSIDFNDLGSIDLVDSSTTETTKSNSTWDQKYAQLNKSDSTKVNIFWNDFLSDTNIWYGHAKGGKGFTVDKLGEAIIAECEAYGFSKEHNPFMTFALYFMDGSDENLSRFYSSIHNHFASSYDTDVQSKLNDADGPIRVFWGQLRRFSNISQLKNDIFRDYLIKNNQLYMTCLEKGYDYLEKCKEVFGEKIILYPDQVRAKFEEITGLRTTKNILSVENIGRLIDRLNKAQLGYFIFNIYTKSFRKKEYETNDKYQEFISLYTQPAKASELQPIINAARNVEDQLDLTKGKGNLEVLEALINRWKTLVS